MHLMTTPILARETDPITSDLAAAAQAWKLNAAHVAVLALFTELGGLTDTELNKAYRKVWEQREYPQLSYDTPRRRRSDLTDRDYLEASDTKRPNDNGKPETVWVLPTPHTRWQNTLTALAAVLLRMANKEGATRS